MNIHGFSGIASIMNMYFPYVQKEEGRKKEINENYRYNSEVVLLQSKQQNLMSSLIGKNDTNYQEENVRFVFVRKNIYN